MKDQILSEIKRLAVLHGKPPGKQAFTRETGIKETRWSGVYWARWGDALAEAGFEKNKMQERMPTVEVLSHVVTACKDLKCFPSSAEMRLYGKSHPSFPSHTTISNHFRTRKDLLTALIEHVRDKDHLQDVAAVLPELAVKTHAASSNVSREGFVYLIRSGDYYKIGQSDQLERRVKEIRISLPSACTLEHSIRTDDPPGIEAYWHRRFAHLRANGEWFKLGPNELRAFRKRTYQ